jgi:hypothetical protein
MSMIYAAACMWWLTGYGVVAWALYKIFGEILVKDLFACALFAVAGPIAVLIVLPHLLAHSKSDWFNKRIL